MTRLAALAALLAVSACGIVPQGPDFVSAQFPPGTGAVNANAELETANSLPPGAANYSTAPGATMENFGSITIGRPY